MNELAAAVLTAMAVAVVPVAIAPAAHADVCGEVVGGHVDISGCTHIAGDVAARAAVADADDTAAQVAAGLAPYYTPAGQPY